MEEKYYQPTMGEHYKGTKRISLTEAVDLYSIEKYYVPLMEEFCVGFEFECRIGTDEKDAKYRPAIVNYPDYSWMDLNFDNEIKTFSVPKSVRVKHLNREDIESFANFKLVNGWGRGGMPQKYLALGDVEEEFTELVFNPAVFSVFIYEGIKNKTHRGISCIFRGTIKNKSEFKKILIQTGVLSEE